MTAPDKANSTGVRLTPRQARLIAALLPGKPVSRERVDRICGASNGPEIVRQLRTKFGHDAIETTFVDAVDRDGRHCRPGYFTITGMGLERIVGMGVLHVV